MTHCSSIETQWFLKAEEPHAAQIADGIEGLAYIADAFKIEIWALSGRYRTMYGPALVPLIPDEPPILNSSHIQLSLRITPLVGNTNSGRVALRDLTIESQHGKAIPDLASWYKLYLGQRGEIGGTYSRESMPEFIEISSGIELEMTFFNSRFAEIGKLELAPAIFESGRQTQLPRFHLTPRRDRHYTPWIIPFAYPGVR